MTDSIDESLIAEFLQNNLNFFERYPDILTELRLPHASGKAVSLVEKQVAVLRERNIEMRQRLSNLIDNARENDRLFDKTKRLTLALLQCDNFDQLIECIYHNFAEDFNVEFTQFHLMSDTPILKYTGSTKSSIGVREHLGKRIDNSKTVVGGLSREEISFLFGEQSQNIGSAALAIIKIGNHTGLLALGNSDVNYYHSSMGTLFLSYIGEVLSILSQKLLKSSK